MGLLNHLASGFRRRNSHRYCEALFFFFLVVLFFSLAIGMAGLFGVS
jgi:hypothetical protein